MKAKLKKKKLLENKKEILSTGGGPNNLHVLTPLEEKISEFLCLNQCVDPPGQELGLIASPDIFPVEQQNAEGLIIESVLTDETNTTEGVEAKKRKIVQRRTPSITIGQRLKLLENHNAEFKNLKKEVREMKE